MAIPIIIGCEIRSVILGPCPIPDRICKPERKTNDTVRRRRDDQAAVYRRSCTSTDDENITGSAQISDVSLGRYCWGTWRREPESNRRTRLCRPLHNHSAIAPIASPPSLEGWTFEDCLRNEKGSLKKLPLQNWSGRRVSNSRPQPWQGCALPTELLPRTAGSDRSGILAGF